MEALLGSAGAAQGSLCASAPLTVVVLTGRAPQVADAAQEPSPPKSSSVVAGSAVGARPLHSLSLSERYGTSVGVSDDASIGQYKVSIKETITQDTGEPAKDGQPRTSPPLTVVNQLIYSDRPTEVSGLGQVRSVVRRYDKAVISPHERSQERTAKSLEGLTIWYRPKLDDLPQIISLTTGRRLMESDYQLAARQLYVPELTSVLPTSSLRIGDTWQFSKQSTRILVGSDKVLPGVLQGSLKGKLADVRKEPDSPFRIAVLDISGQLVLLKGPSQTRFGVRAQVEFLFRYKSPRQRPDRHDERRRDHRCTRRDREDGSRRVGHRVCDFWLKTRSSPRRSERLMLDRELVNTGVPLRVPTETPKATPENSWLTYVDPAHRFRFQHPQELYQPLVFGLPRTTSADKIELVHMRSGMQGVDHVVLEFSSKPARTPEEVRSALLAEWKTKGVEVLQGGFGWLPEAQWPRMKVYHFESAILTQRPQHPRHRAFITTAMLPSSTRTPA